MNKICRNEKGIYTEFYTNSVKFDGQYTKHGQGYWASDCELLQELLPVIFQIS